MTLMAKTPNPEKLERWNELGDELYAAQASLQRARILAAQMHGKRSGEVRRLQRLIISVNRERNELETRVVREGFFDPPRMSPIRGACHRAERKEIS